VRKKVCVLGLNHGKWLPLKWYPQYPVSSNLTVYMHENLELFVIRLHRKIIYIVHYFITFVTIIRWFECFQSSVYSVIVMVQWWSGIQVTEHGVRLGQATDDGTHWRRWAFCVDDVHSRLTLMDWQSHWIWSEIHTKQFLRWCPGILLLFIILSDLWYWCLFI